MGEKERRERGWEGEREYGIEWLIVAMTGIAGNFISREVASNHH